MSKTAGDGSQDGCADLGGGSELTPKRPKHVEVSRASPNKDGAAAEEQHELDAIFEDEDDFVVLSQTDNSHRRTPRRRRGTVLAVRLHSDAQGQSTIATRGGRKICLPSY